MNANAGTTWSIGLSEGLDAIAFLGALSGVEFYVAEYPVETERFSQHLDAGVLAELATLRADADAHQFGLLWPALAVIYSGATAGSLDDVIELTGRLDDDLLPPYRASAYWNDESWRWFNSAAPVLRRILEAMRTAGFAEFRRELIGSVLDDRAVELGHQLEGFDVVELQRRLSGKELEPHIDIVLLYFCRPHGVRIQRQRFIQSADWDLMTTVRIAAHELLHPPIDMDGAAATRALKVLEADTLMTRIVTQHNPSFGYTTLDGYLNEDICQALDQLIIEQLSVARNPADRWQRADDGMHVLAAGLYGLLREDRWVTEGGSIEEWLARALASGRLAPDVLHRVAARVLERPVDQLWPLT